METDSNPTDMALIDAYQAGDAESFSVLYERYRRPLYRYLNGMLPGQTSTVDEIYQQAWIKATNNIGKYRENSFLSWLIRIARNTAIDHFRREQRRQHVDIDETPVAASGTEPWRDMGNSELTAAISKAVSELPDDQREVFLMRQEEISFKDIATAQDCSINTALGRMRYAVLSLRKQLREWV
jgi:RNA polymerase sigma-70 factor (ECF subfamily)